MKLTSSELEMLLVDACDSLKKAITQAQVALTAKYPDIADPDYVPHDLPVQVQMMALIRFDRLSKLFAAWREAWDSETRTRHQ